MEEEACGPASEAFCAYPYALKMFFPQLPTDW
jgi:hypothetical protein